MKKITPGTINYAAMGLAALRPGMVRMCELMGEALRDLDSQIEAIQGAQEALESDLPISTQGLGRGSELYKAVDAARHRRSREGKSNGWGNMTAEERSAEMKRRQALSKKKGGKNAAASWWAKATPAQRAKRSAAMQVGKKRKQSIANIAKSQVARRAKEARQHVNGAA